MMVPRRLLQLAPGAGLWSARLYTETAGRPSSAPYLRALEEVPVLVEGIARADRLSISRAITLAESTRPDHQMQAAALLRQLRPPPAAAQPPGARLAPAGSLNRGGQQQQQAAVAAGAPAHQPAVPAGQAHPQLRPGLRVGVSGPPGAGKSSLIETLGCAMVDAGDRVAVLAVDPSSGQSGGAILGDKTRMPRLSASPAAFVRPTPARGSLGGVARATSDAIAICEAAGFNKVLVETVGVGQSETAVADLTDCLLLVVPPLGGDELQVIKRGITELADVVAVNKADGANVAAAQRTAAAFSSTLRLHRRMRRAWAPIVLPVSAHSGEGIEKLRALLEEYRIALESWGELQELRCAQRQRLAWAATEEGVLESLRGNPAVRMLYRSLLPDILSGELAPRNAAELMTAHFAQYD